MDYYKFKGGLPGQNRSSVKRILVSIITLLLVLYGIFNARNLILGPSIEIFSPVLQETETRKNTASIKGKAENVVFISLNERPIFIDPEGFFEEKLLLSPGFNIIEIKAKDRFKNETSKVLRIYYKEVGSSTEESLL